jgi:hypothetical protein
MVGINGVPKEEWIVGHLRITTIKGLGEDEEKCTSYLGIPFGRPERLPSM